MKLIKNAFVYKVKLPAWRELSDLLQQKAFTGILPSSPASSGFFVNPTTSEMVTPIEGGYSFTFRHDEKIVPAAAVNKKLAERVAELSQQQGRTIGKKEKRDLRDTVLAGMIVVAFSKTTLVDAFYHSESGTLVVATGSKTMAERIMSYLVDAVGSAKFTTIVISEMKRGLTAKLRNNLESIGQPFRPFSIGSSVVMKGSNGKKLSILTDDIHAANEGIIEAINNGFEVDSVALTSEAMSFRLTSDFVIRSIVFADHEQPDDIDHDCDIWRHEAAIALLYVTKTVEYLCDLFDYKPAEEAVDA